MATGNKFRFFLPEISIPDAASTAWHKAQDRVQECYIYYLSAEDSHHALNVARLKPQEEIVVVCKKSNISYVAEILGKVASTDFKDSLCKIEIKYKIPDDTNSNSEIILIFGISKGSKNDLVCEKATELGASSVIFWQTTRSIVRMNNEKAISEKLSRLKKISLTAAKQCHRNSLPRISIVTSPTELEQAISEIKGIKLTCSLQENSKPLREYLTETYQHLSFAIGPEGDFTKEEYNLLEKQGFAPVSLGKNILRSETAAIVALAIASNFLSN